MWIQRDISDQITGSRDFVQILVGPRQCGKTSLLAKLEDPLYELSLDDLSVREQLQRDPGLLLSQYAGKTVLIDEAQFAPELFPYLKRQVDLLKREGQQKRTLFRLTGSNQILMDKNVKESLAGRASFFELGPLSVREISRELKLPIGTVLYQGGLPELYAESSISVPNFLDDYITSYIEKDVVLSAGIQKSREFLMACRLLAARTGQILNASEVGAEIGVEQSTVREWLSLLERMRVVALIPAYSSNLTSRLIKRPKLHFHDTGLAVRLQGWSSAEAFLVSPQAGSMFETLVFTEIWKTMKNFRRNWQIFHWRTRDGEEVDFVIEGENGSKVLLEVKMSPKNLKANERFPEIKKAFGQPRIFTVHAGAGELQMPDLIAISKLGDTLLRELK